MRNAKEKFVDCNIKIKEMMIYQMILYKNENKVFESFQRIKWNYFLFIQKDSNEYWWLFEWVMK